MPRTTLTIKENRQKNCTYFSGQTLTVVTEKVAHKLFKQWSGTTVRGLNESGTTL